MLLLQRQTRFTPPVLSPRRRILVSALRPTLRQNAHSVAACTCVYLQMPEADLLTDLKVFVSDLLRARIRSNDSRNSRWRASQTSLGRPAGYRYKRDVLACVLVRGDAHHLSALPEELRIESSEVRSVTVRMSGDFQ